MILSQLETNKRNRARTADGIPVTRTAHEMVSFPDSYAVQLSACETLTHVSMCPATKRDKQVSEEEDKDDGANLPEIAHHFRWQ